MTESSDHSARSQQAPKPDGGSHRLRLWPGLLAFAVLVLARFVLPVVIPQATIYGLLGAAGMSLAIVLWWLFFSRAAWVERISAVALIVVGILLAKPLLHESVATSGQGALFYVYAVPAAAMALVAWAYATRNLGDGLRRGTMVAALLAACLSWALVRTGGVTGDTDSDFAWRWSKNAEERLLALEMNTARSDGVATKRAMAVGEVGEADWPGFRGPGRDGVVRGLRIATDWSSTPPVELWRKPIGPGWSSFSVGGGLLFTQEQRGEQEIVACYEAATGDLVWQHKDEARFWESMGGAGPRATPTLHNGKVYAFGATGILNALDARDGSKVWSRDVVADIDAVMPGWGFASSPLVVDNAVLIAAGGQPAAYDAINGDLLWSGETSDGYSSPHRLMIDGTDQVVLMSGVGAIGLEPETGKQLWQADWSGAPIVQPAITPDGDLLVAYTGDTGGLGIHRLSIRRQGDSWTIDERWQSIRLKPNFSDFVIHDGNAYGFDGGIMASIDIETGDRNWKGGRYGHGQLLLLRDQDALLVTSEDGELVLVAAKPEGFEEIAKVPGIEGKTWNHPVVVGDRLFVRNGEEMAAFRLPAPTS